MVGDVVGGWWVNACGCKLLEGAVDVWSLVEAGGCSMVDGSWWAVVGDTGVGWGLEAGKWWWWIVG